MNDSKSRRDVRRAIDALLESVVLSPRKNVVGEQLKALSTQDREAIKMATSKDFQLADAVKKKVEKSS